MLTSLALDKNIQNWIYIAKCLKCKEPSILNQFFFNQTFKIKTKSRETKSTENWSKVQSQLELSLAQLSPSLFTYLLFDICYLLLAICYFLFSLCYLPLSTYYLQPAMCYLLLDTYYLLLATCYILLAICCLLLPNFYLLQRKLASCPELGSAQPQLVYSFSSLYQFWKIWSRKEESISVNNSTINSE